MFKSWWFLEPKWIDFCWCLPIFWRPCTGPFVRESRNTRKVKFYHFFFFLKNGIIIICENTYSSFKKYFIKRISWDLALFIYSFALKKIDHFSHRSYMNHILPLWRYFGDLLRIWRLFYDCNEEAHVLFIWGLLWDQNYLCADCLI